MDATIEFIEVNTPDLAQQTRFLGSLSVRVDGADVEPSANSRDVYGLMSYVPIWLRILWEAFYCDDP